MFFFLHDTPSSKKFNPQNYFEGSRLTDLSVTSLPKSIQVDESQFELNKKIESVVKSVGVKTINPFKFLCDINNNCLLSTVDFEKKKFPIYKDDDHLRPFFVREYVNYLDEALWQK